MPSEAFFTDIRAVLLREIGLARHSIHVAVAWFTDRVLFAALLERQRAGIAVALCLTRDEKGINFQPGGLPFAELEAAGGRVTVVEDRLMHHKFCILDGRDVLTGSYNWTNKAAHANEENIVLTTSDAELARHFLREFQRLTGPPDAAAATGSPAVERALKRLGVIKTLLALHKTEDLPKHIERLEAENLADARLPAVVAALRTQRYAEALELLQAFVAAYAQVRVWEDPLLPVLQLEIRLLETELLALEAERGDAYRQLLGFELWHQQELGALLQEVLGLRRDTARYHRQESTYSESEYQQAKQRYQQQANARQEAETVAAHTFTLDADGRARLKKLYREAVQLCHPDRAAPAQQAAATAAFQQLQAAYQQQNIAALEAQLVHLRQGQFTAAPALTTLETLRARRDALAAKHAELLHELTELRASEAFILAQADEATREAYTATNRAALTAERDRLRQQLTQLEDVARTL